MTDEILAKQPGWPVYTESQPWGKSYLFARIWYCGDEWCDCSQAQIELVDPNTTAGRPWVTRETRWQGTFVSPTYEDPFLPEQELTEKLDELERLGVPIIGPRPGDYKAGRKEKP